MRSERADFEQIDRRLALAFLAVAAALMVATFVVGSALYFQTVRRERARLAEVIAHSMGPSFEVAKRAGEYRMGQLAAQMREGHLGLEYIRIVDAEHGVLVHEGAYGESLRAQDAQRLAALSDWPRGALEIFEMSGLGVPVTEVAYRMQGGYEGEWVAVLRVGLATERPLDTLLRVGRIIGGVLFGLLLIAWPVVRWMSRRLAAPIRTLARDFEGVMQHAPLHITIEDSQGRIDKASATFRAAFDVSRSERPPAADVLPAAVMDAAGGDAEVRLEVGGEPRVLLATRFPVALGPNGEVERAGVIATDVTAWRRAQTQVDQLAAAVENADDQVLVTEVGRGVVYANPAFLEQTGHAEADVLGADPTTLLFSKEPAGAAAQEAVGAALARNERYRGRVDVQRKDARPYVCDLLVSPIDGAEPPAYVWMGRDVSRESQLELQLRQSQKMEAVGRLAGGVAHDFNNLLTVINGVAGLLLHTELEEAQAESVRMVADAGRRAADLTRQLLAFSRRQVLELREIDLNGVVQQALPLLRSAVGKAVDLRFSPGPDLWVTRADVSQVEQVLMNLTINAKDADGHRISISTENAILGGGAEADGTTVEPGEYVVLAVADDGSGMDPDTLAKVFEPFFTTKGGGKGTGLGLATVHGIVRQSGGHVFVFSTPGIGTTFRLALPRVPVPGGLEGFDSNKALPLGDGQRILVVDDDAGARTVFERLLEQAGYVVEGAGDAASALERMRADGPAPDLVLVDLVMPGMGGVELSSALAEGWPDLPVLYISGFSPEAVDFGLDDAARLVAKPPSTPTLLEAVSKALRR